VTLAGHEDQDPERVIEVDVRELAGFGGDFGHTVS
jgi:hypothetical protein